MQPIISSHGAIRSLGPAGSVASDYYPESDLIWLDADTKIRELSDGKKSLDDFAKRLLSASTMAATSPLPLPSTTW